MREGDATFAEVVANRPFHVSRIFDAADVKGLALSL